MKSLCVDVMLGFCLLVYAGLVALVFVLFAVMIKEMLL